MSIRPGSSASFKVLDGPYVVWKGRRLLFFGGCDYLRLSAHPAVRAALKSALGRYGLTVSASRLTTGDHHVYLQLERELARFVGVEAAVLSPSGYTANLLAAQALAGTVTHILIDERAHASLVDAAKLIQCQLITFRHRSTSDIQQAIARFPKSARPIILTDGLFARDGAIAPLAEQLRLLPRFGRLLVDDAHGFGVLGESGRGTPSHTQTDSSKLIHTVTLSKAIGAFGGAVLGTAKFAASVRERSSMFGGSTPMPLPLAGAALEALRVLRTDQARRQRLFSNTNHVKSALRASGIALPDTPAPIVCVRVMGQPSQAALFRRHLLANGIYAALTHYPGGPPSSWFRFVLTSEHSPKHLDCLVRALVTFDGIEAAA